MAPIIIKNSEAKETEVKKSTASLPPLTKEEKIKAINSLTTSVNNEAKAIVIQKLGTKASLRVPSIQLNLPTVDEEVVGCGGIPRGRIIEIFGPESGGKTTFALQIIACAQQAGGMAGFVDAEHALDVNYAKKIGVNSKELVLSQPDYGEQALDITLAMTETRAFDVIVVDSVSALVPKAELDGDMGDSHMGLHARLMSQAMRKLVGAAAKTGTTIIFINQIREKIGVMFGNPETTTGGRALKFFASLRLEIRRVSKTDGGEIKDEKEMHIGHWMKVEAKKNKVGSPFRKTKIALYYETGFDNKADVITWAVNTGVVVEGDKTKNEEGNGVAKGWYGFAGETYREKDLTEPELFAKVSKAAYAARDTRLAPALDSTEKKIN